MARPRQHKALDCPGTVQAVFVRRGAEGRQIPIGTICTGCETFVREEGDMELGGVLNQARAMAEAVERDLIDVNQQITAYEFAEKVGSSGAALVTLQRYQQRWFGVSLSLALRRHLEADARTVSLRALLDFVIEHIDVFTIDAVGFQYGGAATSGFPQVAWSALSDVSGSAISKDIVVSDRDMLERMARKLRRVVNAHIHDSDPELRESLVTWSDLSESFWTVDRVADKYCGILSGIFRYDVLDQYSQLNSALMPQSTDEASLAPYKIGEPGVPFDALPYNKAAETIKPYISLKTEFDGSNLTLRLTNHGLGPARRLRIFVPVYGGQALNEMILQEKTSEVRIKARDEIMRSGTQYVIEFEDIHGYLYRQYSWVQSGWQSSETGIPYLVKMRIVN